MTKGKNKNQESNVKIEIECIFEKYRNHPNFQFSNFSMNLHPIFHKNNMLLCNRLTSFVRAFSVKKLLSQPTPGQEVCVKGWVQKIRNMKNVIFLDINDGSCYSDIQIVVAKDNFRKFNCGDSLVVKGQLRHTGGNNLEIQSNEVNILGASKTAEGYPFTPNQSHTPEYLRNYLHLRPKQKKFAALLRVRHHALMSFTDYLNKNDFINIHTPILTSNDCEGAGETFFVTPSSEKILKEMQRLGIPLENAFFDKKIFLSVSGQLHLEAVTNAVGNTYTFSPAFRAENSRSPIHLSEFYMLEAEFAFQSSLEKLSRFIEKMLKTVTEEVFFKCCADLQQCGPNNQKLKNLLDTSDNWPIVQFDDALEILCKNKDKLSTSIVSNDGFSKEQEVFLTHHFNSPVFITNWPKQLKPFYMRSSKTDPEKVDALDLLVPTIGELVGGGLRENDLNRLKQCQNSSLNWYLELRKFGNVPTAGFGLGFERYLLLITGIKNIRDVIPFPRWAHHCFM